jgi:hypothetical protein
MRRLLPFAVLVLLASGAGWVAAQPRDGGSPPRPAARPAIAIRGHVSGLHPGAIKRVRLRLRNRSRRDHVVTRIHARVLDAGGGCSARNLRTRPMKLRRLVPRRSSVSVRYRIAMVADAASSCQGKRFPLRSRARLRR